MQRLSERRVGLTFQTVVFSQEIKEDPHPVRVFLDPGPETETPDEYRGVFGFTDAGSARNTLAFLINRRIVD